MSYAIGVARPTSVAVETFGTGVIPDEAIVELIRTNFDMRPGAIIRDLDLRRPIFQQTATYGHFGRNDLDLPWERLDKVEAIGITSRAGLAPRPLTSGGPGPFFLDQSNRSSLPCPQRRGSFVCQYDEHDTAISRSFLSYRSEAYDDTWQVRSRGTPGSAPRTDIGCPHNVAPRQAEDARTGVEPARLRAQDRVRGDGSHPGRHRTCQRTADGP